MPTPVDRLRKRLTEALKPSHLEIIDDSHKHVGHAGAKKGGHYRVVIVAEAFTGRPLVARHRMVYEAVSENLRREVHALSILARAPGEMETNAQGPSPSPGTADDGAGEMDDSE